MMMGNQIMHTSTGREHFQQGRSAAPLQVERGKYTRGSSCPRPKTVVVKRQKAALNKQCNSLWLLPVPLSAPAPANYKLLFDFPSGCKMMDCGLNGFASLPGKPSCQGRDSASHPSSAWETVPRHGSVWTRRLTKLWSIRTEPLVRM